MDAHIQCTNKSCFGNRNYKICKTLFNPKRIDSYTVNQLIRLCLQSRQDYDEQDPTKYNNFAFFKQLLAQTKHVNGTQTLRKCMHSRRTEYFEYLLEVNNKLDKKFKVEDVWEQIGALVNSKLLRSMITTNIKG